MKSNLKLGIVLLVFVIIVTALIDAGKKEKINWNKTYNPKLTKPYDTYVFKKELSNFLGNSTPLTDVNKSLYQFFGGRTAKQTPQDALVFVGYYFDIGESSAKKLLDFVHKGGTAFISAYNIDPYLLDSLKIGITSFSSYQAGLGIDEISYNINLVKYRKTALFDRIENANLFDILPQKNLVILGNIQVKEISAPNFIAYQLGKGTFYLQLEPDVFTNYYLLKKETFPIGYHAVHYLKGKNILWYDGLYNTEVAQTPMRFILSDNALRSAWYILLVSLLFYLIFKSKREQRAIPVVLPEENKSIAFAKTISSLYYENGTPANMLQKKIQYFLFDIRKQFQLDTSDLNNPQFQYSLSQRTGVDSAELATFLNEIQQLQKKQESTLDELKSAYQLIENFKQKAQIL